MKRYLLLAFLPFTITFVFIFGAYINGVGCSFKITRGVGEIKGAPASEEFGVCRNGLINFVITDNDTGAQWSLNGHFLSIGKQVYIVFFARDRVSKEATGSLLDKEMYVSQGVYLYNYAALQISDKKLALLESTPSSQFLLYKFDGKLDLWDAVLGYDKLYHNLEK